ncbi:hypothetical protein MMC13_001600, partial [Lambiella insularis]|nr:hypothetical protein [Lambiella insularis]
GLMLFGVPHRGSNIAFWGSFGANLLHHAQLGFGTNRNFVEALQKNSRTFADISQQFVERGENLIIRTFFETEMMGNRLIVDKDSASLNLPNEIAVGIARANHRTMCKFGDADSQKYRPVRNAIADMVAITVTKSPPITTLSAEEARCLRSLYLSDYEGQKSRQPKRLQGTCEWFTKHATYRVWFEDTGSSLLWVSADPGCGKSVLSSFLVDELKAAPEAGGHPSRVCYFFFKDDNDSYKSAVLALCSLLHQLCTANNQLIRYVMNDYRSKGDKFVTEFDTLWRTLTTILDDEGCGNVICVLDALDECGQQSRNLLIDALVEYYSQRLKSPRTKGVGLVKFLLTSRPYPTIERRFDPLHSVYQFRLKAEDETSAINEDVERVINARVEAIGSSRKLSDLVQNELKERLIKNADKTFLWVSLVLQLIEDSARVSRKALDNTIRIIPDSLDAMYEKILAERRDIEYTKKLLHIVLAAAKPLSLKQINLALNITEHDKSHDDIDFEPDIETAVRDTCGPFIKVHKSHVYLIHLTAKEFLVKPSEEDHPVQAGWRYSFDKAESNLVLARSCIWYLYLNEIDEIDLYGDEFGRYEFNRAPASQELCNSRKNHSFMFYAATRWAIHYNASNATAEDNLSIAASQLCTFKSNNRKNWYRVFVYNSSRTESTQQYEHSLHVAASLGLKPVLAILMSQGRNVDFKDINGKTALHAALDPVGEDEPSGVALFDSCERVAELLIRTGASVEALDGDRCTPLHYAAFNGSSSIVQILLDRGASVDPVDAGGSTPIHYAAFYRGSSSVVQLLLDKGAAIDPVNDRGSTPLHSANGLGSSFAARILLDRGTAIDPVNSNGATPLHIAAGNDSSFAARILLDRGASVNPVDDQGKTPLHYAASYSSGSVARLLLDKEAYVDSKTPDGTTPLHLAAVTLNSEIVRLLLERNADVNAKDCKGQTPLMRILDMIPRRGRDIIKTLLNFHADVNAKDWKGRTPLMRTLDENPRRGLDIIKTLLNFHADTTAIDNEGRTAASILIDYLRQVGLPEDTGVLRPASLWYNAPKQWRKALVHQRLERLAREGSWRRTLESETTGNSDPHPKRQGRE